MCVTKRVIMAVMCLVTHYPPRRGGRRWLWDLWWTESVALRQVFSECFNIPCQSFYLVLHTHLSSGAGTVAQLVADVSSGLSLTSPQELLGGGDPYNILDKFHCVWCEMTYHYRRRFG
jgi:hypothetical protein